MIRTVLCSIVIGVASPALAAIAAPQPDSVLADGARCFREGKFPDARMAFDRILADQPKHVAALAYRARTLAALKEYDRALTDADAALQLDPQCAGAYAARARVWQAQGQSEKALLDAAKASLMLQFRRDAEPSDESLGVGEEVAALQSQFFDAAARQVPPVAERVAETRAALLATQRWLAERYERREDFAAARRYGESAVNLLTQIHGGEHWKVADGRWALRRVERLSRLAPEARQRLREADQFLLRAVTLYRQGQVAEGISSAEKYAAAVADTLGRDSPEYATGVNNVAAFQKARGDLVRAEPRYRQALGIRRAALGDKHPDVGQSLNNLATVLQSQGDYAQAEPLYRQSLELIKATAGENDSSYATSLDNLANLYSEQGNYVAAEPLFRQALKIRQAALGEQHADCATSLDNLANLYCNEADYEQAEPLYQHALKIRQAAVGEKHPDFAYSLNNLAQLYRSQGKFTQAEPLYRQAQEIWKTVLGDKHPVFATCLNNLASVHEEQGDAARAEPLYRQALEIRRAALGEKHPGFATSLNNLAGLCSVRGDYAQAEPLYRQALEIKTAAMGDKHPDVALAVQNLGMVYFCQGELAKAEPLLRQSLDTTFLHLQWNAAVQSERQQLLMGAALRYRLDNYLSLATRDPHFAEAAFRAVLRWKGLVWNRQRQIRAVVDQPELESVFKELQSVTTRLARIAMSTPDPQGSEVWRRQLDELTQKKEALEKDLAGRSAAWRAAQQEVTLKDLSASLPREAALVDFFEYRQFTPPPPDKPGRGTSTLRLLAFLVRTGQAVEVLDLGPVAPLAEAIDAWRTVLGRGDQGTRAGQLLRERIWAPLEPKLAGAKFALISPDGVLGRLPLAALPGRETGRYLLEDWALATIPVPQVLPSLIHEQERKGVGKDEQKNLLLIGGVDYDAKPESPADSPAPKNKKTFGRRPDRGADWRAFTALEGTQGEIASLEKMYRHVFGAEGVTVLENQAATEERFVSEAPRHLFLHVATHGFFAPPSLSSALASNVSEHDANANRGASDSPTPLTGRHPGLLSGLALAGANQPPREDRADGILTAEETQTLDLRGVELAVLSACETGLGEVAGGEGLLGLQRSFHVAGARTVVASLWKVDDTQTRALMERFYRNLWEKELSKLEALRETQLAILHEGQRGLIRNQPEAASDRSAPFYWAAFVLSGDWR